MGLTHCGWSFEGLGEERGWQGTSQAGCMVAGVDVQAGEGPVRERVGSRAGVLDAAAFDAPPQLAVCPWAGDLTSLCMYPC